MSLEDEVRKYLNEICIDMGFCLPMQSVEELCSMRHCTSDEFIREVFLIEGLDPEIDIKLFRELKRKFTDRFGNSLEEKKNLPNYHCC